MALYTVRSERMCCEQLDYNLLYRRFLDMDVAEPSFDRSTFSRNRARLLENDVAREFFTCVSALLHRQRAEREPARAPGADSGDTHQGQSSVRAA
jgi:Transposase domain (DUF772)